MANRALVLVQDGASDTAIVILQGVAKVVALVLAVVLAEHAEVILHFLTSSLTRRRSTDKGRSKNVDRWRFRKHVLTMLGIFVVVETCFTEH